MNPRNCCNSFLFWGSGQSLIASTFPSSILIESLLMMSPKNSISLLLNQHFSGFKDSLCSLNQARILPMCCSCSFSFFEYTKISSMYITTHPSIISSLKISFIMVWKVAGELVNPKNITKGSNNPQFVLNAAFHLSPSFIRILLQPHLTSILENIFAWLSLSISSDMSGRGYQFLIVISFNFL